MLAKFDNVQAGPDWQVISAAPLGCATTAAAPSPPAEFWLCSVLRTRGAVQDALFECNCSSMAKIRTYCHGMYVHTSITSGSAPAKKQPGGVRNAPPPAQFCKIARAVVACKPRQPRLTSLQPFSESSTTYSIPVHLSRIRGAARAHVAASKNWVLSLSAWPTWGRHQESSDPDDKGAYDRLVQKLQKY